MRNRKWRIPVVPAPNVVVVVDDVVVVVVVVPPFSPLLLSLSLQSKDWNEQEGKE